MADFSARSRAAWVTRKARGGGGRKRSGGGPPSRGLRDAALSLSGKNPKRIRAQGAAYKAHGTRKAKATRAKHVNAAHKAHATRKARGWVHPKTAAKKNTPAHKAHATRRANFARTRSVYGPRG